MEKAFIVYDAAGKLVVEFNYAHIFYGIDEVDAVENAGEATGLDTHGWYAEEMSNY